MAGASACRPASSTRRARTEQSRFLAVHTLPAAPQRRISAPFAHASPRPSSSGLGRRPFTAKTGVRVPLGAPEFPSAACLRRQRLDGDSRGFAHIAARLGMMQRVARNLLEGLAKAQDLAACVARDLRAGRLGGRIQMGGGGIEPFENIVQLQLTFEDDRGAPSVRPVTTHDARMGSPRAPKLSPRFRLERTGAGNLRDAMESCGNIAVSSVRFPTHFKTA